MQKDSSSSSLGEKAAAVLKDLKRRKLVEKKCVEVLCAFVSFKNILLCSDRNTTYYIVSKGSAFTTSLVKGESGTLLPLPIFL